MDAAHLAADGLREGASECRLTDSGDVFDEDVTPCEQRHQGELDGFGFPLESELHTTPELGELLDAARVEGVM